MEYFIINKDGSKFLNAPLTYQRDFMELIAAISGENPWTNGPLLQWKWKSPNGRNTFATAQFVDEYTVIIRDRKHVPTIFTRKRYNSDNLPTVLSRIKNKVIESYRKFDTIKNRVNVNNKLAWKKIIHPENLRFINSISASSIGAPGPSAPPGPSRGPMMPSASVQNLIRLHAVRRQIAAQWKISCHMQCLTNLPLSAANAVGISNAYLSIMRHIATRSGYNAFNRGGKPSSFLENLLGVVVGFKQNYASIGNSINLWNNVRSLKLSNLPIIELRDGVYKYEPNGMYVCFANKRIGGSIVGSHGFVQEEIAVFESNQFPLQVYWKIRKDPQRGAIELGKLDEIPAILKVNHLFNVKPPGDEYRTRSPGNYFGCINWNHYRADLEAHVEANPDKFVEVTSPREIFWLNMAAIKISNMKKSSSPNSKEVLRQMLLVAYRAFREAIDVLSAHGLPPVIHTGNWGAGAFGHHVKVAFAIQRLAAWWAAEHSGTRIQLIYYTYRPDIHAELAPLVAQSPMKRSTLVTITNTQRPN